MSDLTDVLNDFYGNIRSELADQYTKIFEEMLFVSNEQHTINVLAGTNYIDHNCSHYITDKAIAYLKLRYNIRVKVNAGCLGESSPDLTDDEKYILVERDMENHNKVRFKRVNYNGL